MSRHPSLAMPVSFGDNNSGLQIAELNGTLNIGSLTEDKIRNVHKWLLGSYIPNDRYDTLIRKRMEGSCRWILDRPFFETWSSTEFSEGKVKILWVHGPAGFGKTVLCTKMIEHLNATLETPVVYFFFSEDQEREDPFLVMRSWLSQMVSNNPTAFTVVQKKVIAHGIRATCTEIMNVLRDIVVAIPGCTFIMDGLDESTWVRENQKAGVGDSVDDLMDALKGVFANTKTRLLVLSRDEPEIRSSIQDHFACEDLIEHRITPPDVRNDIGLYSKKIVDQELRGNTVTERESISRFLADRCEGQFLWVALQDHNLRRRSCLSQRELEEAILSMPTKLETVYEQTCKNLAELDDLDRRRSIFLLRWVAFSVRPLTVNEITEALLISEEADEIRLHELPTRIDEGFIQNGILLYCRSLLEVRSPRTKRDIGLSTVHLAHFSVKQYLLRTSPMKFRLLQTPGCFVETLENTQLAKMCLRYIYCQSVRREQSCGGGKSPGPFFNYAAGNWYKHSFLGETRDPHLVKFVNRLFEVQGPSWSLWIEWFNLKNPKGRKELYEIEQVRVDDKNPWVRRDPSRFGIVHLQFQQLANHQNPGEPVYYAALLGFADTMECLITRHGDHVNEKGIMGRTALLAACKNGHFQIAEFLLAIGAEVELADDFGWTPLYAASTNGHIEVVKLLVEKGANMHVENKHRWTPINAASTKGHAPVVELLIMKGASFRTKSRSGWTPLNSASANGHLEVVKLLLEKGADVTITNQQGRTPLSSASTNGHLEIVQLLLEKGADITTANQEGLTPLNSASTNGHLEIVQLLLEKGADITTANRYGEAPVHSASMGGHLGVIKLLLERQEIFVDVQDNIGRTPLFYTAARGNLEALKLLLLHNASLNSQDRYQMTPLSAAIRNGHEEVISLLLSLTHVTAGFEHNLVSNLVWWATRSGCVRVVNLVQEWAHRMGVAVAVYKTELNLGSTPITAGDFSRWCDVCTGAILNGVAFYSCKTCFDFDICLDCFSFDFKCLDSSHELILR